MALLSPLAGPALAQRRAASDDLSRSSLNFPKPTDDARVFRKSGGEAARAQDDEDDDEDEPRLGARLTKNSDLKVRIKPKSAKDVDPTTPPVIARPTDAARAHGLHGLNKDVRLGVTFDLPRD